MAPTIANTHWTATNSLFTSQLLQERMPGISLTITLIFNVGKIKPSQSIGDSVHLAVLTLLANRWNKPQIS